MSCFWEFHMFLCSFYLLTWLISMAGRELHVVLLPLDFPSICFNRFKVPTGNFHYKQILKNSKLIHILLSHPWFKIFGFACFPKRKLRRTVWLIILRRNAPQFGQNVLKNAPQKNLAKLRSKMRHRRIFLTPSSIFIAFLCINFFQMSNLFIKN